MSVRRLRAELNDLRSRIERQRRPVFVFVERGETNRQAVDRAGVDVNDPTVDLSFIDILPEEQNL